MNYTFEINNDNLFEIENEYIYYKVIFGSNPVDKKWYLGKPISLKYKFIFNRETKQIGIYNKNYNQNNNKSAKKDNYIICNNFIKYFINELDDNYEYMSDDQVNKKDTDIEEDINH